MWRYFIILVIFGNGCSNKSRKSENKKSKVLEIVDKNKTPNIEELIKLFNNPKVQGRQHILYKLNELKYPKLKVLLETALYDEDEYVKIMAIQLIKNNKQIESINKLIQIFRETESHVLASNLTRTFVDFQLNKPVKAIIEKLNSENNMIVYNCIWTLGEIGSNSEIEVLQKLVSNSDIPKIYDNEGFLIKSTQFTIGEMAKKSILKIRDKYN